jgi:hypothetical protein
MNPMHQFGIPWANAGFESNLKQNIEQRISIDSNIPLQSAKEYEQGYTYKIIHYRYTDQIHLYLI